VILLAPRSPPAEELVATVCGKMAACTATLALASHPLIQDHVQLVIQGKGKCRGVSWRVPSQNATAATLGSRPSSEHPLKWLKPKPTRVNRVARQARPTWCLKPRQPGDAKPGPQP